VVGLIKEEFGIAAEHERGRPGGFAICVNGSVVARKRLVRFPSDKEVVSAVRQALRSK